MYCTHYCTLIDDTNIIFESYQICMRLDDGCNKFLIREAFFNHETKINKCIYVNYLNNKTFITLINIVRCYILYRI